jgi:hypothetical protein
VLDTDVRGRMRSCGRLPSLEHVVWWGETGTQ